MDQSTVYSLELGASSVAPNELDTEPLPMRSNFSSISRFEAVDAPCDVAM